MAAKVHKLGPGTITIGETGTELDFSCQVTAAHVDTEVDEGDEVTVLCGDVVPGARTYSHTFAGTLLQDLDAEGIVAYSWDHAGEAVPFSFTPSTAIAAKVDGELILDPLTIGGDEAGQNMTSDYEWAIVGTPTFTPASAQTMATKVKVEGLARLERTLKDAGHTLDDLKALHGEVGGVIAEGAAPLVPVKTGALAASVRSSGTPKAAIVRAGGAKVPYAGVQEFGWPERNIPPHPALTASLANNEDTIIGLYEREVDETLAKVKGA